MAEDFDGLLALEAKHRKEKKELQAKIQALKKAAKNDKNKKKELSTEIAMLEMDIDVRHKRELEDVEKKTATEPKVNEEQCIPNAEEPEIGKAKISKAQKRRDKKSQQEKERTELIKQQEKENINGPRNLETQAITTRLKERKLQLFLVPSDGDCLYQAVSHQLSLTRDQIISVGELRRHIADYIRNNKDDFIPFMSNPDTFDMLTDSEFDEYCDKITITKVWGGQLEIRALSNSLRTPIKVIQATGPESIDQGEDFEGQPLIITYHRHMYSLGEHYNSTQPFVEN